MRGMGGRRKLHRRILVCFMVLASLGFSSCASYSSGKLPERRLEDLERAGKLPAITYEVIEARSPYPSEHWESGDWIAAPLPTARIEPLFRRLFVASEQTPEAGAMHIELRFRHVHHQGGLTLLLGVGCILTLGLLPCYGEDAFHLDVHVIRDGAYLRQYGYAEELRTWGHWFALPWAFSHAPLEVKDAAFDNLLLNLVHDLQRDLPELTRNR